MRREHTTLPQWTKRDLEKKEKQETKEGEPIWADIAIGQIAGKGKEHIENKMGMQDSIQLIESFEGKDDSSWIGVYDGHYLPIQFFGNDIMPDKLVVAHLVEKFREQVKAGEEYEDAFKKSFDAVDKTIIDQGWGGSTASVMLIEGKEAWVANVGDSYIYKFGKDKDPELLTSDHNVYYNTEERTAAMNRGADYDDKKGYIYNKDGPGLQLSRSLGDRGMGDLVISTPDVTKVQVSEDDEWIVAASDGLWEELKMIEIKNILRNSQNAEDAKTKLIEAVKNAERVIEDKALGTKRIEKGNYDDVSVVVIELK